MVEFIFDTLFGWPLLVVCVLGYLVGTVRHRRLRGSALILLAAAPAAAFLIEGIIDGCALRRGGEECMWFGFGMVLLPVPWLFWLAALFVGVLAYRFTHTKS